MMNRRNKGRVVLTAVYVLIILLSYALVNAYVRAWNKDDSSINVIVAVVLTLIFLGVLMYMLSKPDLIP